MEQFTQFITDGNKLHPAIFDMLCTTEGYINKSFFEEFFELNTMSSQNFLKALKDATGHSKFEPSNPNMVGDVTEEEFFEQYEFAKYPHTLGWIFHFYQQGKYLSKQSLFRWLMEDSKPHQAHSFGGDFV